MLGQRGRRGPTRSLHSKTTPRLATAERRRGKPREEKEGQGKRQSPETGQGQKEGGPVPWQQDQNNLIDGFQETLHFNFSTYSKTKPPPKIKVPKIPKEEHDVVGTPNFK